MQIGQDDSYPAANNIVDHFRALRLAEEMKKREVGLIRIRSDTTVMRQVKGRVLNENEVNKTVAFVLTLIPGIGSASISFIFTIAGS